MRFRFNIHQGFPIIGHLFYATWGFMVHGMHPTWLSRWQTVLSAGIYRCLKFGLKKACRKLRYFVDYRLS
jgi:hypothetical protein